LRAKTSNDPKARAGRSPKAAIGPSFTFFLLLFSHEDKRDKVEANSQFSGMMADADTSKASILRQSEQRKRALSPNGALPMIPPAEYMKNDIFSQTRSLSPTLQKTALISGRPDMRYDDNEFAFTAHLILARIKHEETRDINRVAWVIQDGIDVVWSFTSGEDLSMTEESMKPVITRKMLSEFDVALKYRMKFLSARPSVGESELQKLTRTVALAVSGTRGYPKPNDQQVEARQDDNRRRVRFEEREPASKAAPKEKADCFLDRVRQCFFPDPELTEVPQTVKKDLIEKKQRPTNSEQVERRSNQEAIIDRRNVDRSFEEETVLLREFNELDRTFENDTVVYSEFKPRVIDLTLYQPSGRGERQISDDAYALREISLERQRIAEETKRVSEMLRSTRSQAVQEACRHRLQELQSRLQELSGAPPTSDKASRGKTTSSLRVAI
jgi:hypothetical protein